MKTVTQLAFANNRSNKSRSILTILSIILTTMLLMVIATWGNGAIRTQKANAGNLYGSYYGQFKNISANQLQQMKRRSEFEEIGKLSYIGEVESKQKRYLYSTDSTTRELTNLEKMLEQGSYPKAENEIAAQEQFFKDLGYANIKIGDKVKLNYRKDMESKFAPEEFVVSGILKENELGKSYDMAYVSEEYYNRMIPKEERLYTASFTLNDSIEINADTDEEVLKELGEKIGVTERNISVNSYYLLWALDPGTETITVCAVIAVVVILFSIAVIYNIFQVGITWKIQEYGKLKAIGMTRKQLKQVIQREGMILAVIGVPIGLLLGYIVSVMSFSLLIEKAEILQNGVKMVQVSLFSVPVLLLAALLAFLTVWIALKKPMKMVSSVSIIEAIRYQENSSSKNGYRKGKKEMSVNRLMFASISQNRKRITATIFTMGLSCVLFVVMANLVGNMDEEYDARKTVPYGQYQIELDYAMNDKAYPKNNLENILKKNPLSDEQVQKIKAMDGVTKVRTRKIFIIDVKNHGPMTVSVLNKEEFKALKEDGGSLGIIDYDKAVEKEALIYGWAYGIKDNGLSVGQEIKAALPDQRSWESILQGAVGMADTDWVIAEDTFEKLNLSGEWNGYVYVDCQKKDLKKVEKQLKEFFEDTEHIEISSYQDALKNSALNMQMLKAGVYSFLTVIGLIGFMNLANTLITNVVTRKQEFVILQAIGMTNRQLQQMLQREGILLTAGTILVAMLFGIPLGYASFCYGKENGIIGLHIYHFPIMEILLMFVVMMGLQLVLSFLLSRNVKVCLAQKQL